MSPFAGYQDFSACLAANGDKDDPAAYCGAIQATVEGKALSVAQARALVQALGHRSFEGPAPNQPPEDQAQPGEPNVLGGGPQGARTDGANLSDGQTDPQDTQARHHMGLDDQLEGPTENANTKDNAPLQDPEAPEQTRSHGWDQKDAGKVDSEPGENQQDRDDDDVMKDGRTAKTKTVSGEVLHASDFAYVGDPEDVATWKLPIQDEGHVHAALSRYNQTEGIPPDKKAAVRDKILRAAHKHGIDTTGFEEKHGRAEDARAFVYGENLLGTWAQVEMRRGGEWVVLGTFPALPAARDAAEALGRQHGLTVEAFDWQEYARSLDASTKQEFVDKAKARNRLIEQENIGIPTPGFGLGPIGPKNVPPPLDAGMMPTDKAGLGTQPPLHQKGEPAGPERPEPAADSPRVALAGGHSRVPASHAPRRPVGGGGPGQFHRPNAAKHPADHGQDLPHQRNPNEPPPQGTTGRAEKAAVEFRALQEARILTRAEAPRLPQGICGRLTGVGLQYNVVDDYGTVFLPGCLDTTRAQKVAAGKVKLYRADASAEVHPHGANNHVGIVRTVTDDGNDVVITADLLDTEEGRRTKEYLAAALPNGGTGLSIGFRPLKIDPPISRAGARVTPFREVELVEFSITPIPAVPGTDILALRAHRQVAEAALQTALRTLPPERIEEVLREQHVATDRSSAPTARRSGDRADAGHRVVSMDERAAFVRRSYHARSKET